MYGEPRSSAPYTFTAHAPDIDVDTQPELLRAEMERAEGVVTVSEHNREYLLAGIHPGQHRFVHQGQMVSTRSSTGIRRGPA